ncbi:MAG: DsrE family protein [Zavarzinella sp.]
MPGKFCVSLTHAKDNADKATVAFAVANAAVSSKRETVVFLSVEGVRLAQAGYSEGIHEEGFPTLKELIETFTAAGGKILVCTPCLKKRGLDDSNLIAGARLASGIELVEFMAEGCATVSY